MKKLFLSLVTFITGITYTYVAKAEIVFEKVSIINAVGSMPFQNGDITDYSGRFPFLVGLNHTVTIKLKFDGIPFAVNRILIQHTSTANSVRDTEISGDEIESLGDGKYKFTIQGADLVREGKFKIKVGFWILSEQIELKCRVIQRGVIRKIRWIGENIPNQSLLRDSHNYLVEKSVLTRNKEYAIQFIGNFPSYSQVNNGGNASSTIWGQNIISFKSNKDTITIRFHVSGPISQVSGIYPNSFTSYNLHYNYNFSNRNDRWVPILKPDLQAGILNNDLDFGTYLNYRLQYGSLNKTNNFTDLYLVTFIGDTSVPPHQDPATQCNSLGLSVSPDDANISSANGTVSLSASVTTCTGRTVASQMWTRIQGPGNPSITSPNQRVTNVTGMTNGQYTFRFTVTDNTGNTIYEDASFQYTNAVVVKPNLIIYSVENTITSTLRVGCDQYFFPTPPLPNQIKETVIPDIKITIMNNSNVAITTPFDVHVERAGQPSTFRIQSLGANQTTTITVARADSRACWYLYMNIAGDVNHGRVLRALCPGAASIWSDNRMRIVVDHGANNAGVIAETDESDNERIIIREAYCDQ